METRIDTSLTLTHTPLSLSRARASLTHALLTLSRASLFLYPAPLSFSDSHAHLSLSHMPFIHTLPSSRDLSLDYVPLFSGASGVDAGRAWRKFPVEVGEGSSLIAGVQHDKCLGMRWRQFWVGTGTGVGR